MMGTEFIDSLDLMIFDLDGTLIDSYSQIETAMNIARKTLGYSESPIGQIFENLGLPVNDLFSDLTISSMRKEELIAEFRMRLYESINLENKCFPHVELLLNKIRKSGIKVAIATGKSTSMASKVIENSALYGSIDFIQGTDGFLPKPNPEVIDRCLKEFPGLRAVMIGDRTEDMIAANKAGIPSIGIAQSAHSEATLRSGGGVLTFKNVSGLYEWITH
jgi:HAD superfamily hydrolase (TIGR01549 family)